MNKKQIVLFILLMLSFLGFSLISPIRNEQSTFLFLLNYSVSFVIFYLIAKSHFELSLNKIILIYFLTRMVIFPMFAWLSDDVFTYLWQGKLWANGVNVYEYFPLDPALTRYHDLNFYKMGNIEVPAIYPPLAVYIFSFNYWLAQLFSNSEIFQFYTWKFILVILEFLSIISLIKFSNINKNHLLIYILCPLPLIEIIGQGHNDGLLLPIISLIIIISNKIHNTVLEKLLLVSSIIIGAAIKLVPIFWLPLVLLKMKGISLSQKSPLIPLYKGGNSLPSRGILHFLEKVILLIRNYHKISLPILITFLIAILIYFTVSPFLSNPTAISNFQFGMNYYNLKASFFSGPLEAIKYLLSWINVNEYWILAPKIIYYSKFGALLGLIIYSLKTKILSILDFMAYSMLFAYLISTKVHTWYFAPIIFILSIINKKSLIFALIFSMFSYYVYLFPTFNYFPILDISIWVIAIIIYRGDSELYFKQFGSISKKSKHLS